MRNETQQKPGGNEGKSREMKGRTTDFSKKPQFQPLTILKKKSFLFFSRFFTWEPGKKTLGSSRCSSQHLLLEPRNWESQPRNWESLWIEGKSTGITTSPCWDFGISLKSGEVQCSKVLLGIPGHSHGNVNPSLRMAGS